MLYQIVYARGVSTNSVPHRTNLDLPEASPMRGNYTSIMEFEEIGSFEGAPIRVPTDYGYRT